ncbi:hypothetical protein JTE90_026994 [Oedothorax gibbosus]|uniref:Cytochrome P450 n=1 Tax=Oedothorax gibbosus TaxID=931172 RepID=A0AAV6TVT6_9ARAC|nr:hypothetical protein JTE90_026994 [Oedothorax gibbosus]
MFEIEYFSLNLVTNSLIIVATVLFFYWYCKRNHDYWEKLGIPFVKPVPFFGSILEVFSTPPPYLELKRYSELGPVYGHFERNRPCLTIGDPKILRKIMVKDFVSFSRRREFSANDEVLDNMLITLQGEQWKRVRDFVTPTFTSGKLKKMLGIFKECSKTLLQNLSAASQQGNPVDAKRLYGAFTMDVIASAAFSTKIDSHNDPENRFVSTAKVVFQKRGGWRYLLHLLFPDLMQFLGVSSRSADIHFFNEITLQIIEERKRTGQTRNDFLQLLIDSSKEDEDLVKTAPSKENGDVSNYIEETAEQSPMKNKSYKNLTVNEMVAQCVIFFLAGYDTTASTLSNVTYCLALNQEVQDKLRREIDTVIDQHKGELTYETIQEMKYLDNVISETLRLYPPVARVERIAEADYDSTDLSIKIPKGMVIGIPMYAVHRDPRHWTDPEKFDPNRFCSEEKAKRDQFAYLPFAAGPRNCVAMRFALLEVKLCLVHVISAFKIKRCSRTKVPLEFTPSRNLVTPKEITVSLEARKETSFL